MKTFEQINKEGSDKYGLLWLKTNQTIVDIAEYYKLDVSKDEMKLVLSAISLGFLNRIYSKHMAESLSSTKDAWWQAWNACFNALEKRKKVAKDDYDGVPKVALSLWEQIEKQWLHHRANVTQEYKREDTPNV